MIIFLKTGGAVAYVSDENINLGSDKANSLFVVAPYAAASSVCVAFKLPNGKTLGPGFVVNQGVVSFDSENDVYEMQKNGSIPEYTFEGQNLSAWSYDIQSVLTGVSGSLGIQLFIFADGRCISTDLINVPINVGVNNLVTPSEPTEEGDIDIFNEIIRYLTETNTYMTGIKQKAAASANEARAWANGTYVDEEGDSQPVAEGTEQYQKNAKYYAEQSAGSAAAAAESAKLAAAAAGSAIAAAETAEEAAETANNVLSTVNNRLNTLETEMDSAEDRLDNAEDRLDNVDYILEQFGAVKAQVDSSAALVKSIPARSDLFAYLNSVGGKTEKYNQLLNLPEGAGTGYYFWQLATGSSFGQQLNEKITTVKKGVTIINNGDGSFTIDGTSEGYGTFELFHIFNYQDEDYLEIYAFSIPVPDGDHYLSFGGASLPAGAYVYVGTDNGTDEGGSGGEVYGTGGALSIYSGWHITVMDLNFEAGTVFNNLTIKPMLNLGTSALPWQSPAYPFTGLRSGKVKELKVYGANKISLTDKTVKNNGIIATLDGANVTITLNGTATADASLVIIQTATPFTLEQGKSYTMSGMPSGIGINTFWLSIQNTTYKQTIDILSTTPRTFTANYSNYYLYITVKSGYTADNIVIKPTLHEGDTVKEPTTYALPEAVQALDGYGEGVTDSQTKITYANTVDFKNRQYIKYLPEKVVFDGVNVKAKSDSDTTVQRVIYTLPSKVIANTALNITHFNVNYTDAAGNAYLYSNSLIMCPSDQSLNTVDKFNAWLKEMYDAGTPVECVYAAATPEVTNISAKLEGFDPVIPVEGGGRIEFVNQYNYDVPSTITYNIIQEAAI